MSTKNITIILLALLLTTSCDEESFRKAQNTMNVVEKVLQLIDEFLDKNEEDENNNINSKKRIESEQNNNIMKYSPIIERNLTAEERYDIAHSMFPQGSWSGEKGESMFMPNDLDATPKRGAYSNMRNLTWREILKENECENGVPYKNGEIDYEAINRVYAKVVFDGDKGIGEYLRPKNGNYDRVYLHEEAYRRLAEQKGVSIDEIKIYKGDSEPVERLMSQWNSLEQDVWKRCGNPDKRIRVFHECTDGRTVILVPRELHDHLSHCGGVEMYDRALEKEQKG